MKSEQTQWRNWKRKKWCSAKCMKLSGRRNILFWSAGMHECLWVAIVQDRCWTGAGKWVVGERAGIGVFEGHLFQGHRGCSCGSGCGGNGGSDSRGGASVGSYDCGSITWEREKGGGRSTPHHTQRLHSMSHNLTSFQLGDDFSILLRFTSYTLFTFTRL